MSAAVDGNKSVKFYDLAPEERLEKVAQQAGLTADEAAALSGVGGLSLDQASHMIENGVGVYGLPLGVAQNFLINGREVLVPMAIEEPSVVAGASFMAKLARAGGGFTAHTTPPEMIGQIQVLEVKDLMTASMELHEHKAELLAEADSIDPVLK